MEEKLAAEDAPEICPKCGSTETCLGACWDCGIRFACSCCNGVPKTCGCTFTQTGKLYYDCETHEKVVRFVAEDAPVKQAPRYFRL